MGGTVGRDTGCTGSHGSNIMAILSRPKTLLSVQSLDARDLPSGSQLFAIAEGAELSRVAVYDAPASRYPPPLAPPPPGGLEGFFNPPDASARLLATFTPYPGFYGGVRVAVGDVTGDGYDDIVTAPGFGGGPHIKVYDGLDLQFGRARVVQEFFAYDPGFRGGVFVGIGQFDPSSWRREIVTGAGESGGPHVRIWGQQTPAGNDPSVPLHLTLYSEFFAYDPSFRGGVRVALSNVIANDGRARVITAPGRGGGPLIRVFDIPPPGATPSPAPPNRLVDEFYAYAPDFRGGVSIAAGRLTATDDSADDLVTGPGKGGGPHVKVFHQDHGKMSFKNEFFAGDSGQRAGVTVGLGGTVVGYLRSSLFVGFGAGGTTSTPQSSADNRLAGFNFDGSHYYQLQLSLPRAFNEDPATGLVVSV